RSVASLGLALEADPAIPMPSKAMANATKALRYHRAWRLATVARMVPPLRFDSADIPRISGWLRGKDRLFGRLGQRQIALRVGVRGQIRRLHSLASPLNRARRSTIAKIADEDGFLNEASVAELVDRLCRPPRPAHPRKTPINLR